MKWVFPMLVGLAVPTAMLFTSQIARPLLALGVLCLQAEYTTIIGNRGESSWVGGSGPSGIYIPLVGVAFVAFFLYERMFSLNPVAPRYRWGKASVTLPVLATLLAAGGTVFYSPEPMRAVFWLQQPFLLYVIFLVGLNAPQTRADVTFIVKLLMVSLALQALIYFAQVALGIGFDLRGELTSRSADVKRFGGTISKNPAAFGSFVLPLLMIALSRFFLATDSRQRSRMALLGLLGLSAVLLTYTRAVWVGFGIGLTVVMVLTVRRGAPVRRAALIVTAACLAAAVLWPTLALRAAGGQTSSAFDERYVLMQIAWRVIRDNPVLGVGAGAYAFVFRRYVTPEIHGYWLYVVHNGYLLRWAETGLMGLLGLLVFWTGALRTSLRASRTSDPTTIALGVGCSAAVLALMWEQWWDISLGFQTEALMFFLVGVLFAAIRMDEGAAGEALPSRGGSSTTLPARLAPRFAS